MIPSTICNTIPARMNRGERDHAASRCMPARSAVYQESGQKDQPGGYPVDVIDESHLRQPFAPGQAAGILDEGVYALANLGAQKQLDRRDRQQRGAQA